MKKLILILILVFALWGYAEAARLEENFLEKKGTLIEVLQKAQVDNAHILFSDERLQLYPQIFEPSTMGPGWEVIFTRESIARGRQCKKENEAILSRVEAQFGVNREILVSLFRVETNLGKDVGKYVVFNSLLTCSRDGTFVQTVRGNFFSGGMTVESDLIWNAEKSGRNKQVVERHF